MELRATSPIVRWAYPDREPPKRTSLCAILWRSALVAPGMWAILIVLSPVIGAVYLWNKYVEGRWQRWQTHRHDLAYRRACERNVRAWERIQHPPEPSSWSVLWQGARAIKARVCPIVEITKAE